MFSAAALLATAAVASATVTAELKTTVPFLALEDVKTAFEDESKFPTDNEGKCKGGLYLGTGVPSDLREVLGQNDVKFLGPTAGAGEGNCGDADEYSYNAIGYNVVDHFLYGLTDHQTDGDDHHLVRINRYGCTELVADVGALELATNGKHIAGDITSGALWASSGRHFRQVPIPLPGGATPGVTKYTMPDNVACNTMNDFAFVGTDFVDESKGLLAPGTAFGFNNEDRTFCSFTTGFGILAFSKHGDWGVQNDLLSGTKIGGFFMDREGNIYMYDNIADRLVKYSGLGDIIQNGYTGQLTKVFDFNPGLINGDNVDGAACADAPSGLSECTSIDKRCCPEDSTAPLAK